MRDLSIQLTNSKRKKQSGVTLLELLLAITVIATLLLTATGVYRSVTASSSTNEAVKQVMAMSLAAQKLYSRRAQYDAGLTVANLIIAADLPKTMVDGPSRLIAPWGGVYNIFPVGGGTGFAIRAPSVPNDQCTELALGLAQHFEIVSVDFSQIQNTNFATPLTATLANTAAACGTATSPMIEVRTN